MFNQISKSFSMLITALGISLALTTNSYAFSFTSSTSTSFFKSLANNADLVCKADDGEVYVDAAINNDGTVSFIMESSRDSLGQPVPQTCCEVPHESGLTVADCEAGDPNCGSCGEFILNQKVEDTTADGIAQGDDTASNCLRADVTGGLETYNCNISKGAPKEYWVWQLVPVAADAAKFCDSACAGDCGVAMGTTDNARPDDYPYGNVWQFTQYKDPQDANNILLADFQGNWCHTGSFCLDDSIQCEVKSAKVDLRTNAAANYTVVDVDTVQTFNGNSTNGGVPTDFLSTTNEGALLVDPAEIDLSSITVNGGSVSVNSSTSDSDRNGDGFNDVRTHLNQADFQQALYPADDCVSENGKTILFKGTMTDGRVWIGPTTIDVVCN